MVEEILIAVIPTITTGVLTVVVARLNKHNKIRSKLQMRENDILYDSIESVGELAEITAICYKSGGIMNGDLDAALQKRREAKEARNQYLKDVNSEMKKW